MKPFTLLLLAAALLAQEPPNGASASDTRTTTDKNAVKPAPPQISDATGRLFWRRLAEANNARSVLEKAKEAAEKAQAGLAEVQAKLAKECGAMQPTLDQT